MSVLLLRLFGPLQAWGSSSRFARRETEREPTKSGVLGLIAAAQGRRRTDTIEDLLSLRFGVRVDQEGELLQDFHTAHRSNGDSMPLTRRFYLSDALFVAGVESHDVRLLQEIGAAIDNPKFPLYLGRRSCVPSGNINMGIREGDLESVLTFTEWQASDWYMRRIRSSFVNLRTVIDSKGGVPGRSLRDIPLSFDPTHREYGWRMVTDDFVQLNNPFGKPHHDPMGAL